MNPPSELTRLRQDLARLYRIAGPNTFRRIYYCLQQPGMYGVITFRFCSWMLQLPAVIRLPLKPLSLYLVHRMRKKWGIEIQLGATIGGGMIIHHYGGIFVSSKSIIGENFSIGHDVTIGVGSPGIRRGHPVIGNNVTISPGAKIYGKLRIGDNVHVGPNAVVNTDVSDNAIVHPMPGRTVVSKSATAEPRSVGLDAPED